MIICQKPGDVHNAGNLMQISICNFADWYKQLNKPSWTPPVWAFLKHDFLHYIYVLSIPEQIVVWGWR